MLGSAEHPRSRRFCRRDEPAAASPFRDALHRFNRSMSFPRHCRKRHPHCDSDSPIIAVSSPDGVRRALEPGFILCLHGANGKAPSACTFPLENRIAAKMQRS